MTTTSVGADHLTSSYLSSYSNTSSINSFTRRHSIYGTEDRVVLDIGSFYIKCGFSGESHPRHIVPTWTNLDRSKQRDGEAFRIDAKMNELYTLDIMAQGNIDQVEEKLKRLLHDIYFRLLLTEPKSRKVILCESPLTPIVLKQTIARLLFDYFQVPSLTFVPVHLTALLTTGVTTGLVLDVGHLETTVVPIYSARPLIPCMTSTPLAGDTVMKRLKALLVAHGRLIPPSHLHLSLAPQIAIPSERLTLELLEAIKTEVLFCTLPSHPSSAQPSSSVNHPDVPARFDTLSPSDQQQAQRDSSHATDVYFSLPNEKAKLLIPGWIRAHAMAILFDGSNEDDYQFEANDCHEDQPGLAHTVLDCLLKLPPDVRKPLSQSMLVIGGSAMVPGFHARLLYTLASILQHPTPYEQQRYRPLMGLASHFQCLDQKSALFKSNIRGWVGGSLMGSLKLSGKEMVKEKFNGTVTDWSITDEK
ncbi:actin-like ATPase domain-containing protein [Hesseltinella vesiculosa]|uniref:Actin-like ATPase domain-containing protein n=1 Tax=Hesseltinella vesiculosa TaxID=101127 RepID=A0A1X2G833_9FUNG|nr:actin-like ATPase domain-containing protein [Hesseltinella vesiculosa]